MINELKRLNTRLKKAHALKKNDYAKFEANSQLYDELIKEIQDKMEEVLVLNIEKVDSFERTEKVDECFANVDLDEFIKIMEEL